MCKICKRQLLFALLLLITFVCKRYKLIGIIFLSDLSKIDKLYNNFKKMHLIKVKRKGQGGGPGENKGKLIYTNVGLTIIYWLFQGLYCESCWYL